MTTKFKHITSKFMDDIAVAEFDQSLKKSDEKYPSWICSPCGRKHGKRPNFNHPATWHQGTCGICKQSAPVTEPRDFGHLKYGWQKQESAQ